MGCIGTKAPGSSASQPDRNVVDLNFMVDGTEFTDSDKLMFGDGTTHTISTFDTQSSPGTMSEFNHWSDGGAMTHQITASNGTPVYTAFFDTQFELTIHVAPPGSGTVTPSSGQRHSERLRSD